MLSKTIKTENNRRETINFHDGVLTINSAEGRTLKARKYENIPYSERTLGVVRYYQAKTAGEQVEIVVAIKYNPNIDINQRDIVSLRSFHSNGAEELYAISHIQRKDTLPASLWITLKDGGLGYADER